MGKYHSGMGRYTVHQVADGEIPPLSKTAARKLGLPPGSFAAYHPDPLLIPRIVPLPHWNEAALAAETAIRNFEAQQGDAASRVGWVLQRSESVGSSTIEDVNPSLRRVARAEAVVQEGGDPYDQAAREVLGNIAATRLAAELGDTGAPISLDDLISIHKTLMDHTSKPEVGGSLRPSWVRIGGVLGGYPPPAYVAPPAEEVPRLLEDLLAYINAPDHHPVVAAAIAHAQFELIHPFRDGNGRTGRAMIQTVLRKHGVTRYTTPPISALLALGRDEYTGSLSASHYEGPADGPGRAASLDPWVSMFTSTAEASCDHAKRLIGRIDSVSEKWGESLRSRRGSGARKILDRLPEAPVFTVASMSDLAGIPQPTAYRAVNKLVASEIVVPVSGKYKGRGLYEAPDLLDVFAQVEDPASSTSGFAVVEVPPQLPSSADTRRDKAAQAVALRRRGRTHKEIAAALDMSTSWAQKTTKGVKRGR